MEHKCYFGEIVGDCFSAGHLGSTPGPGRVAQLAGELFRAAEGCGFNPWLGRVREATDRCFSLSLSPLPPLSLKIKKRTRG